MRVKARAQHSWRWATIRGARDKFEPTHGLQSHLLLNVDGRGLTGSGSHDSGSNEVARAVTGLWHWQRKSGGGMGLTRSHGRIQEKTPVDLGHANKKAGEPFEAETDRSEEPRTHCP